MQDVVVFAGLGPNPAPFAELVWALYRQRSCRVVAARAVAYQRARYWYDREFTHHALPDLRRALGDPLLLSDLKLREALTRKGEPIVDDVDAEDAADYLEAIWRGAAEAVEIAGARPVVFGVIGGRRRTVTVASSACFQLLARPQDICVDVRISDKRAEGAQAGFFFPEQSAQELVDWRAEADGHFLASSVEVQLVDVVLPRLRNLVPDAATHSYAAALAATNVILKRFEPPQVEVDFVHAEVRVNGQRVCIPPGPFMIYAAILVARHAGEAGLPGDDEQQLAAVARRCQAMPDYEDRFKSTSQRLMQRFVVGTGDVDFADARTQQRSKAKRAVAKWLMREAPEHSVVLTPQRAGDARCILHVTVDPEHIQLIGWP